MKQSILFTKTRKESPADEVSKNAELLIKGGFISKEMAGVYSLLPLGLRVIKKIESIVRDEMNKAGGVEVLMPAFQSKERWEKTGRWDSMDDLYKVTDNSGREVALGPTHEENVVPLVQQFVSSYKELPVSVYQIQNKFRMEMRAKSGILRGREFIMKDMYSFHRDEASLTEYYEKMKHVYKNVFHRVGIGHVTYLTFASGGSFSKYSHEFQTITSAGEDTIYIDEKSGIALNKEVYTDEVIESLGLDKSSLVEQRAIEVGNIFELKTKYSAPFEYTYKDESGNENPIIMGCYGIGITRLLGTVVEVLSDDKGILWPESIAPFTVHVLRLGESEQVVTASEELYAELLAKGFEVLFDDRNEVSPGEKFADADLIGVPYRVIVSERSLKEGGFELKKRIEEKGKIITRDELFQTLQTTE